MICGGMYVCNDAFLRLNQSKKNVRRLIRWIYGRDNMTQDAQIIGAESIKRAETTLEKYKQGKISLDQRIVESEKWYRLRHWETFTGDKTRKHPGSAWLFNAIANKHADAMDNYPEPNILPRAADDKMAACVCAGLPALKAFKIIAVLHSGRPGVGYIMHHYAVYGRDHCSGTRIFVRSQQIFLNAYVHAVRYFIEITERSRILRGDRA